MLSWLLWCILVGPSRPSRGSLTPRGARQPPGPSLASPSRQVKARLSLAAPKNRTTPLQPGTGPARTRRTPVSHCHRRVTSSDPPRGDPSRSLSDPRRCAATGRGAHTGPGHPAHLSTVEMKLKLLSHCPYPVSLILSRPSASRSHFRAPPSPHSHPKSFPCQARAAARRNLGHAQSNATGHLLAGR